MTCKAWTSFWRAAGLALACLAAVRPAEGFEKHSATAGKLSNSPQPLNYPHLLSHTLSTHSPSPPPLLLRTSLRAKHNSLRPSAAVFHCFQSSTSTSGDACRRTCAGARLLVLLCHESPRRHLPRLLVRLHRRGLLRLQLNESESRRRSCSRPVGACNAAHWCCSRPATLPLQIIAPYGRARQIAANQSYAAGESMLLGEIQ